MQSQTTPSLRKAEQQLIKKLMHSSPLEIEALQKQAPEVEALLGNQSPFPLLAPLIDHNTSDVANQLSYDENLLFSGIADISYFSIILARMKFCANEVDFQFYQDLLERCYDSGKIQITEEDKQAAGVASSSLERSFPDWDKKKFTTLLKIFNEVAASSSQSQSPVLDSDSDGDQEEEKSAPPPSAVSIPVSKPETQQGIPLATSSVPAPSFKKIVPLASLHQSAILPTPVQSYDIDDPQAQERSFIARRYCHEKILPHLAKHHGITEREVVVHYDPDHLKDEQSIVNTLSDKTRADIADRMGNFANSSEVWRGLTKHRSVTSSIECFGSATAGNYRNPNNLKAPGSFRMIMTTGAAPNLSHGNADLKRYTQRASNGKLELIDVNYYKETMKLLFKRWLYALDSFDLNKAKKGAEVAIIPLIGGGVYLNELTGSHKEKAVKSIIAALAESLVGAQFTNIQEVFFSLPDENGLLSESHEWALEYHAANPGMIQSVKFSLSRGDVLHLAHEISAAGKMPGLINPGSDRTIGGDYLRYLYLNQKKEDVLRGGYGVSLRTPLEEFIFGLTNAIYIQNLQDDADSAKHFHLESYPAHLLSKHLKAPAKPKPPAPTVVVRAPSLVYPPPFYSGVSLPSSNSLAFPQANSSALSGKALNKADDLSEKAVIIRHVMKKEITEIKEIAEMKDVLIDVQSSDGGKPYIYFSSYKLATHFIDKMMTYLGRDIFIPTETTKGAAGKEHHYVRIKSTEYQDFENILSLHQLLFMTSNVPKKILQAHHCELIDLLYSMERLPLKGPILDELNKLRKVLGGAGLQAPNIHSAFASFLNNYLERHHGSGAGESKELVHNLVYQIFTTENALNELMRKPCESKLNYSAYDLGGKKVPMTLYHLVSSFTELASAGAGQGFYRHPILIDRFERDAKQRKLKEEQAKQKDSKKPKKTKKKAKQVPVVPSESDGFYSKDAPKSNGVTHHSNSDAIVIPVTSSDDNGMPVYRPSQKKKQTESGISQSSILRMIANDHADSSPPPAHSSTHAAHSSALSSSMYDNDDDIVATPSFNDPNRYALEYDDPSLEEKYHSPKQGKSNGHGGVTGYSGTTFGASVSAQQQNGSSHQATENGKTSAPKANPRAAISVTKTWN